MKILPTLEGGLRIDTEDGADWQLLAAITEDAMNRDTRLADQLGGLVTAEEIADDWREYIVPDLDEAFQSDVARVVAAIQHAYEACQGGTGPLWIGQDDALVWYGVLNQARLALEEKYRFGPGEHIDPKTLSPHVRSAFIRSQFYCAIQSVLLDHAM